MWGRKRQLNHHMSGEFKILDWLHHSFGIEKLRGTSSTVTALSADAFVTAIREAVPKRNKLTAADIAELKREHAATIEPARQARAKILKLEHALSDLVNRAYGLTPEEVNLMWRTAPPRMPFSTTALQSQEGASEDPVNE